MKRFILLLLIALITLAVLFAWYNPAKLEDVWLWLIGLAGTIIGYARELIALAKKYINNLEKYVSRKQPTEK
jgi:hypothetical protein